MNEDQITAVVLFDGVCHFCNHAVQFIIRRDGREHFKFAPLQSPIGRTLLRRHHLSTDSLDTFVLIEGNSAYTRSTAALRVAKRLSGLWPFAYVLIVVPRPVRDALYKVVAKNRYKWFGASEACLMPTAEVKARFLDGAAVA